MYIYVSRRVSYMAERGSILNSRLDLLTFWNAAYRVLPVG
jgi:hypothetical protein